jgi:tetratricopeptide (TPR) repeat protein
LVIEPEIIGLNNKGSSFIVNNPVNYTEAITYYDKVLAIDPNDKSALTNKGLALNHLARKY